MESSDNLGINEEQMNLYYESILSTFKNEVNKSKELDDFAKYIASISGIIIGLISSSLLNSTSETQPFQDILILLVFLLFLFVIYYSIILIFQSQVYFVGKKLTFYEQDYLIMHTMIEDLIMKSKEQRKVNEGKIKTLHTIFCLFVLSILTLIIYSGYITGSFDSILNVIPISIIDYFGLERTLDIAVFVLYLLVIFIAFLILRSNSKSLKNKISENSPND